MLMNIRKSMRGQKGFTLVELMVVIAIIGVLAAIAVPMFTDSTDSAKAARVQADLRTVESALQLYYADNGSYPATGWQALANALTGESKKYMKTMPSAPSGYSAYTYTYNAAAKTYTLGGGTK